MGLFALNHIKQGSLIGIYCGEYIPIQFDKHQHRRRSLFKKLHYPSYMFDLVHNEVEQGFIDAQCMGSLMRFINHSRNSRQRKLNVATKITKINGQMIIMFYTTQDVKVGSELLLDYGKDFFNIDDDSKEEGGCADTTNKECSSYSGPLVTAGNEEEKMILDQPMRIESIL